MLDQQLLSIDHLQAIDQLQAEVNRCQTQLQTAEREGRLQTGMLQKLCEELREPISNIHMAVRMFNQAASERERERYGAILQTECLRQLEILNSVNRMQSWGGSRR